MEYLLTQWWFWGAVVLCLLALIVIGSPEKQQQRRNRKINDRNIAKWKMQDDVRKDRNMRSARYERSKSRAEWQQAKRNRR